MYRFLIAAIALPCGPPAAGQLQTIGDGQLQTYPSDAGVVVGVVTSQTPGGWIVLAEGFQPVPAKAFDTSADGARGIIVEAPPGTYGEMFFPSGQAKQPIVTRLVLGGTPSPPKPPDPKPPTPPDVPDPISGPLSVVVIRDPSTLTADQTNTLLELRTHSLIAPRGPPDLIVLDRDAKNSDEQPHPVLAGYLAKKPAAAAFPYYFLVDGDSSRIVEHGELTDSETLIQAIEKRSH